jgi:two-component system OmpR family sensor kinase
MSSGRSAEGPAAGRSAEGPAAGRSAARWRTPSSWTLRTRLVATLIALLALACLLVAGVTELALNRVLVHQLDARLVASAGRAQEGEQRPPPQEIPPDDDTPRFPPGQQTGTLSARIAGGQVVWAATLDNTGTPRGVATSLYPRLAALPADRQPHSVTLPELGGYRVLAGRMPDGSVLLTGLPLAEARSAQYGVAAVAGGVTLLTLLAAALVGAATVRRSLRPLSRVAATAGRVTERRLDRGEVTLADRVDPVDTDPRTEVGQVGAALNHLLAHVGGALEARQASETRVRQFLADASHELRTPLAAVRGYAELARRTHSDVPEDLAHALRRVESESRRMTALVEDMLLLARLDAGRPLQRVPVDLSALAVDAVSDAHATAPDHRWRLLLPDDPVLVAGDPERLHQVVANLLANARTHTPPGTEVNVEVAAPDGRAVLRVVDAGPGVAPDLLPHLFERFARGDGSRSRAAGSTGLGLAIVRAVVAAHDGVVEVDSRPGRTAFTVCLPPAAGGAGRDGRSPADGAGTGGATGARRGAGQELSAPARTSSRRADGTG